MKFLHFFIINWDDWIKKEVIIWVAYYSREGGLIDIENFKKGKFLVWLGIKLGTPNKLGVGSIIGFTWKKNMPATVQVYNILATYAATHLSLDIGFVKKTFAILIC